MHSRDLFVFFSHCHCVFRFLRVICIGFLSLRIGVLLVERSVFSLKLGSKMNVTDFFDIKLFTNFVLCDRFNVQFIIGDGNNLYDFTYVENVAHAHVCAERALASGGDVSSKASGQVFFLVATLQLCGLISFELYICLELGLSFGKKTELGRHSCVAI